MRAGTPTAPNQDQSASPEPTHEPVTFGEALAEIVAENGEAIEALKDR